MARGGFGDIGYLALDPEARDSLLEQRLDLAVELADGDRGCRRIRLARFFHAREYNEACKAFAENLIGVELSD